MIRTTRLALALGFAIALAACQQSSPPASTATPAAAPAAPAPSTPAATPAAAPAPTATVAAPAGDSIGIPECDDYLNKYQACVQSKAPESARAALIASLDQTRAAWRAAAVTPAGKDSLAAACKQVRDSSRASMNAYGCSDF